MAPKSFVDLDTIRVYNHNFPSSVREEIKIRLIEIGHAAVATVAILAVLSLILFVAGTYFHGWRIFTAIATEVAILVFLSHVYRWFRYPGLFHSRSAIQLFSQVMLSILLMYSIPLIAILARFHVVAFLPLDKVGYKLGLEFKFKMRDRVLVKADAPFHAGEVGRITKIRVASEDLASLMQIKTGDVIYGVRFADGIFEMPERYIL